MDHTKFTKIEELRAHGKTASLSAESFVVSQSGMHTAIQAHDDSINTLTERFQNLEQQVKGIARIMASQNIQKLSENIKLSQDELSRNLINYVNDKNKDIVAQVEREVTEVVDAKSGIQKKIDGVEQNIMTIVGSKLEEASAMRYAMRDELERIKDMIENVPGLADKNAKLLRQLDTKVTDLKQEFRTMEREHETANLEQDKQVAGLTNEIRHQLETAKDKLMEEAKGLSKSIRRHEGLVDDKVKTLTDMIEKETKERLEVCKNFPKLVTDSVGNSQAEIDKKIVRLEMDIDRKVRPFMSSIQEIKRLIDEEGVHRQSADQEVARNLAAEIKDRHHDEEKLLSLISTCQATVSKMHKLQ
eukprot:TRINITY_DN48113_c0_g1_i1.p1 TRINITY_DN48113_c0_g1~~TRINITY_DN48113_c0_g1_i1.p1  ORF type:complete len:388 (+),score=101.35 TRINITY_DN48113_c0_g1_i1:90-1166(+)